MYIRRALRDTVAPAVRVSLSRNVCFPGMSISNKWTYSCGCKVASGYSTRYLCYECTDGKRPDGKCVGQKVYRSSRGHQRESCRTFCAWHYRTCSRLLTLRCLASNEPSGPITTQLHTDFEREQAQASCIVTRTTKLCNYMRTC